MKIALLIAPLAIVTAGTLGPRLFSPTTSNLGVLGNDAEKLVIREMAQRLDNTPDARVVTVTWWEDNGQYKFLCNARYEPGKKRLVSHTETNEIEFFPITPESLHEIATKRVSGSFASATAFSLGEKVASVHPESR